MQMQGSPPRIQPLAAVRIGDSELNFSTRECRRGGQPVQLRPAVFDLLALLLSRRPATVSRVELMSRLGTRHVAAPSVVARAVMEARKAIGDDPEAPRWIVNVRGVGYRFCGDVEEPAASADPAVDEALREVRELLVEAQASFEPRDDELAHVRALTEQALGLALRQGYTLEYGQALCWLSYIAVRCDDIEAAASCVAQAMHLAEAEGQALLLARARASDGALRRVVGDIAGAITQLTAAHDTLVRNGEPAERLCCERMLAKAAREIHDWGGARHWCAAALRTAERHGMVTEARSAEIEGIAFALQGYRAMASSGEPAQQLTPRLEELLTRSALLLEVLDRDAEPWTWIQAMGLRAHILGNLGRCNEARASLQECAEVMALTSRSPYEDGVKLRAALEVVWAEISLRENKPHEALNRLFALTRSEGELSFTETLVGRPLEVAERVAERCGRFDLALAWCRRRIDEQRAERTRQMARLTRMLHTQSMTTELQRDLDILRQNIRALQHQNADLLQQLAHAEGAGERSPA